MRFSKDKRDYIEDVIKTCIRDKFKKYNPETSNMPFHFRLLGKDRMALYSFIHSLNTSFGTSIFEPAAIALAKHRFVDATRQYKVEKRISEEAYKIIQNIINDLTTVKESPNKDVELEKIRAVCQTGKMQNVKLTNVDIFLRDNKGAIYLFDIKTAKPNMGNFKEFKRTILEWAAAEFAKNPQAQVNTAIAIPYNPYEPEPYQRWTLRGMLDLEKELYVANEFWDFLGGEGSYEELLNCFERAGIELRNEIDEYFSNYR